MLLLEIEKKENKNLKIFQKLLEQIRQNPQYIIREGRATVVKRNSYEETDQELAIFAYTYTIPK